MLGGVAWELVARYVVSNPLFLAPLSDVWRATLRIAASGDLARFAWVSLQEFLIGFALAIVVGVGLGLAMAVSRPVQEVLEPWVTALQATPLIALGPLFVLWFGLGPASKVAVVFIVAMFPILVNTYTGILGTPVHLVEAARSFGARPSQIYREVMLPAAVPVIVAGLRLGMARGLTGVVVGELFASKEGLGFLILFASQTYDTAALFTGVLIFALAGVASTHILLMAETRLAPWRKAARDD
jgi:NitT/TauT family transport system permease protein